MTDTMDQVRLAIAKRCVRLADHFHDFDKLRSGCCSTEQAKRVLTITGVFAYFTEEDWNTLTSKFPGKTTNSFNYQHFLAEVEGSELPPGATLRSPRRIQAAQAVPIDEAALAKAVKSFVHTIKVKSLDIRLTFKDFDRHNIGKVTVSQFERAFPFTVEPSLLKQITAQYTDEMGKVDYKHWVEDMLQAVAQQRREEVGEFRGETLSPTAMTVHQSPPRTLNTADEVLVELRGQFSRNRIRVDETLRDFDKTHCGSITEGQFRGAIGSVKLVHFVLTGAQLAALVDRYAIPYTGVANQAERRVDYRQFLADVNALDGQVSPAKTRSRLSPEEEAAAQKVLEKVRNSVQTQRMNLRPTFQDFDRATKGVFRCRTCTRTRFQRALALNKVILTFPELALLERKYAVLLPGEGDSDSIDYVAFCDDVDAEEVVKPVITSAAAGHQAQRAATAESTQRPQAAAPDLDAVIEGIAQQVALRRMRMKDFFQDFDPLRSGVIPTEKFGTALSMSAIKVSEAELNVLLDYYRNEEIAHTTRYTGFVAEVDRRSNAMHLTGNVYSMPKTKDESNEKALAEIFARIAQTVRGRGILLPPFFLDYDRHHCGRITATQFQQVISRHRFPVNTTETELLCKHFSCPDDPVMVQYRPFLGAIDESEDIIKQHTQRLATRPLASPPRSHQRVVDSSTWPGVQSKIKAALLKGARISEFMRDVDGLRKGYIPCGKFLSALDMAGVHLTDDETAYLTTEFAYTALPDTVDYVRFLGQVNALSDTLTSRLGLSSAGSDSGAVASSDPSYRKVVEKVKKHKQITRRGAESTADAFRDFDKLKKGRVTVAQFHSVMTGLGLRLSADEVKTLNSTLNCGNGEVSYSEFCRSIDN
jgi:Ca2+-binding EF-hand superfamily protein